MEAALGGRLGRGAGRLSLRDLRVSPRLALPARLLSVRFARAGGPGGQNVNRVATRVDLRLDLRAAEPWLGPVRTARVRERLAGRLDRAGRLQVVCASHRTQARNLETALERMEALLREALVVRRPRRASRPSRASRERRLTAKRQRGARKRERRGAPED